MRIIEGAKTLYFTIEISRVLDVFIIIKGQWPESKKEQIRNKKVSMVAEHRLYVSSHFV